MKINVRRWFLVPTLVLLGAGLVEGGADLPGNWTLVVLGVPFVLTLIQLLRPTKQGWRLAFGTFCLLILSTMAIDLSRAIPRGLPSLLASAAMVALFLIQFGIPAWLLWLAKPGSGQPSDSGARSITDIGLEAGTGPELGGGAKRGDMPPNHPLQATAGVACSVASSGAFARGA